MKIIERSALTLASAAKGCPMITTIVVFLFWLMFNLFESLVELILFGKRFEHWLDIVLSGALMAYSAYAVYACAIYNSKK